MTLHPSNLFGNNAEMLARRKSTMENMEVNFSDTYEFFKNWFISESVERRSGLKSHNFSCYQRKHRFSHFHVSASLLLLYILCKPVVYK